MKDKISKILEKEIWISEDYDARKDKSQYFIEGIYSATDELLTLFNSEIAKALAFEALCNPDIYEASANEHFEHEYKEQNQVIEILKGHIDDLQEQIAKRDELIRASKELDSIGNILLNKGSMTFSDSQDRVIFFNELYNKEVILRNQINKLKAELK